MMTRSGKAIEVLLVEDNPGDVRLAQESLKEVGMPINLNVAVDGVEAIEFLRRRGPHATAPRPDLILLDLNLPKKDGLAVLSDLKADDELRRIPVVVLTTSKSEDDIRRSYDLKANCYVTKPPDLDRFVSVVRSIQEFWLQVAQLPP